MCLTIIAVILFQILFCFEKAFKLGAVQNKASLSTAIESLSLTWAFRVHSAVSVFPFLF